jgi:tetratricopeptide (TPR) repeat protein
MRDHLNDDKSSLQHPVHFQEPGKRKKSEARRDRNVDNFENEFQYSEDQQQDDTESVVGTSSGSIRQTFAQPLPLCPFAVRRQIQPIPVQVVQPSLSIDEVEEWTSEFAATEAHKARIHEDEDAERMAEAAADLLSQMNLENDEKLRNSNFVRYLKELAEGKYEEVVRGRGGSAYEQTERADFDQWKQIYEDATGHLATQDERDAWNEVIKDWQSYSSHGLGYEGFAERQFHYQSVYTDERENPFSESQNLHEIAENLWLAGRSSQAILAFEAIVQRNPNDSQSWYRLGQLQVENEQDILAIAAFQRALAGNNLSSEVHRIILVELAGCLVNEQCRPEAIEALKKFIKTLESIILPNEDIDPSLQIEECLRCLSMIAGEKKTDSDPLILMALSILYCMAGDSEQALGVLSQLDATSISITDRDHLMRSVINRRGALHANNGDYATALTLYDRVIAERPEMVRAYYNRGVSLFNAGNYQDAIDSLVTALSYQSIPDSQHVSAMREDLQSGLYHVWDLLRLSCEMIGNGELVLAARQRNLSQFKRS